MAKPSVSDVKTIIDTSLSDPNIQSYIDDASAVVDEVYPNKDKLLLKKWMAAHLMATTRERQAQTMDAVGQSVRYAGKTGMGLDSTTYGQQLKSLDFEGKLVRRLGKKEASVKAVKGMDWDQRRYLPRRW